MTVSVYGLSYQMPEYISKSLPSMLANLHEEVCFTVVDNKTENSAEIFSIVKPFIDSGKVKRYVQLAGNDKLNAFNRVFALYPPDESETFFVFTELDLIVGEFDWVRETRLMQKSAILSGFKLGISNYVPPNGGHIDDGISVGFWLMGLNTKAFKNMMDRHNLWKHPVQDYKVRGFMSQQGKQARSNKELYHLGWDLWKDDEAYFARKVAGVKWHEVSNSPIEFVYEL